MTRAHSSEQRLKHDVARTRSHQVVAINMTVSSSAVSKRACQATDKHDTGIASVMILSYE